VFLCESIHRLTEARYIKLSNGRPFISPQDFEIAMFLLMSYMEGMEETMEIKVKNLDELSQLFADFVYSKNTSQEIRRPDKAKMQRALKRLKQLKIIDYRAIRWPKSVDKSVRRVIVTIKPISCDVSTEDLILENG
jgi:hypothetical protein